MICDSHKLCNSPLLLGGQAGQLAARPVLAWVDPGRADFWVTHMLLYIHEIIPSGQIATFWSIIFQVLVVG